MESRFKAIPLFPEEEETGRLASGRADNIEMTEYEGFDDWRNKLADFDDTREDFDVVEKPAKKNGAVMRIFDNPDFGEVRTIVIDDEPWFVGRDVASILGYKYPANAIQDHVDEEDKTVVQLSDIQDVDKTPTPNHMKGSKIIIINESGLYSLVLRSELSGAKNFKKWVTSEVLPSIRKTGKYSTEKETREAQLARALVTANEVIRETEERHALAHAEAVRRGTLIREMKPKVEYYNEMIDAGEARSIRDTAQLLGIKEKEFVWWLIEKKFLYRDKKGRLKPYSKHVGKIFITKDFETKKFSGSQVMVSAEGRLYFKKIINTKK